MKKSLLLVPAIALSSHLALAVSGTTSVACGNGQFVIGAEFSDNAVCDVEQMLTVNGETTTEQYSFEGSMTREIPLMEGDVANVRAVFRCEIDGNGAGGSASARTSNGCSGVVVEPTPAPTPVATPTTSPEPTATPTPPGPEDNIEKLQAELDRVLTSVEDQMDSIEARVAMIEERRPEFAAEYLESRLARLARSTNRRLDRIVGRYQDEVSAVALDKAVMAFRESYELVTNSPL